MDILNLIIAIVALIIAVVALLRTGGIKDLKQTTADTLAKWERKMREEKAGKAEKE